MRQRQQNSTTYPISFFMADSVDRVTGKTGLTPTVTLSKNGSAFAGASGAVSEVANGWYRLAGNAGDRDTLGELIVHADAAGADAADLLIEIVSHNPFDAGMGSVVVDHDTGGTDALAYKTSGGVGIDNAVIRAYLKTDYDAGNLGSAYIKATTTTDVNGRWSNQMNLDPATYTLYYFKQGAYGPDTQEVTVE